MSVSTSFSNISFKIHSIGLTKNPLSQVQQPFRFQISINKFLENLNNGISLATIKIWCQVIRQSGSIQLLGTHDGPQIVKVLKRIYKKLKIICTENRRYQFENFRENSVFLQQISDED